MPLQSNELASRASGALVLRSEPLRGTWALQGLPTRDGHLLDCRFSASVRCVDAPADRRLLEEVFLAHEREQLTLAQVIEYLLRPLNNAAGTVSAALDAAEAVSGRHDQSFLRALQDAARPLCFSGGIELLAPMQVQLDSATLRQQMLETAARDRAQKLSTQQVERLQRAGELLRQFQEIRRSFPELSAGDVLERISPTDRGQLLQSLLLASAAQATERSLYGVAGPFLLRLGTTPQQVRAIDLPRDAGPLRSVQSTTLDGRPHLLIGAQRGLLLVEPESPEAARIYLDPELESPLGFNRVVYRAEDGTLWATHSDGGVVMWHVDQPARPALVLRAQAIRQSLAIKEPGAAGPGNLSQIDSARFVLSLGSLIVMHNGPECSVVGDAGASVVNIIPGAWPWIITQSGRVNRLDPVSGQITLHQQRPATLTAAAALPWLGSQRLLLATELGPVDCVGEKDPLVTQYLSIHRGLRALSASQQLVAGLSPDRQRVVLWDTHETDRPRVEIPITPIVRHRVADLAFL